MFDAIDTRHDQVLDHGEWANAFGAILTTGPKVSVKPTSLTYWENGVEAQDIGKCLARNRKLLIQSFKQHSTHSDHQGESRYVTFEQAKKALDAVLQSYCFGAIPGPVAGGVKAKKPISDDKLACILRVG